MHDVARNYQRYALGLLAITLLMGVAMRAAQATSVLATGMNSAYLVHAHSHVAFFGWAVLAAFAIIIDAGTGAGQHRTILHALLPHLIGTAAALAFVGFALRGYDAATITLSALHVTLWVVFVVTVLPALRQRASATTQFFCAALCFLITAGAATIAPVVMMVRGVEDPWLLQLGVKLFLTQFVGGFLLLTAFGTLYQRIPAPRHARLVLSLIAVGTLPSALLYVAAAPPTPWLLWLGRAGSALVAAGILLFVRDATRVVLPPLARVVVGCAALQGALQLLAAAGVGASFMHNRPVTIAFLHLVLLGVVTPALVLALRPTLIARTRARFFATGLLVMTLTLFVMGWPWGARVLAHLDVPPQLLSWLAFLGGATAAFALIALAASDGAQLMERVQRSGWLRARPRVEGAPESVNC